MTESNEIMNGDSIAENSEPLLVGTNISLDYDASEGNNLTYDTESQPLAIGTNLTLDITYAEAELLEEQLGISLDGSDNYLGSNITIIGGDRDWLERIDGNPAYSQDSPTTDNPDYGYSWDLEEAEENIAVDGENEVELATDVDFLSDSSEPLLVGTNITFNIKEDTDGSSDFTENGNLSERDEKTLFALGTNLLLELPGEDGQQDNFLGTNLSTIGNDSQTQTTAMEGNPFEGGMMPTGEANPTSSDNDDYTWDFGGQLASFSSNEGMGGDTNSDALFAASPWGALEETGAVDGFEDVFPNGAGEIENNSFAGGFGGGEI